MQIKATYLSSQKRRDCAVYRGTITQRKKIFCMDKAPPCDKTTLALMEMSRSYSHGFWMTISRKPFSAETEETERTGIKTSRASSTAVIEY